MKSPFLIATLSIFCLASNAFSQQAKLEGYVVNDKDFRVPSIRIVSPGGQAAVTDSKGHFIIAFPPSFEPGRAVHIEVSAPGWVILDPLMGDCVAQNPRNFEPLKVVIVPSHSLLALSPKALRQAIDRWAKERAKLRGQVAGLRSKLDEYAFLREYAEKYGFTLEQFENAAQQWAKSADSNDKEEQALKEYFLKNYERAARLAHESALTADEGLEQANAEKAERSLEVIRRFRLEGDSLVAQKNFRGALAAYNEIDKRFSTNKLSEGDLKEEWADVKLLLGTVKEHLGARVDVEEGKSVAYESLAEIKESKSLLSESLEDFRQALTVFTRETSPQNWALMQNNMGDALSALGELTDGEEGAQLLAQSVEAFRQALTVYTREASPQRWAWTQKNMSLTLHARAQRLGGEEGARLLARSVEAFRQALTVFTRESEPDLWAATQVNLGTALNSQGELLGGEEGKRALAQAVESFRQSSTVFTREASPHDWASTQSNMGNALTSWGELTGGEEGAQLLAQAVEAFRRALTVYTREASPQDWAATQNNLGLALHSQAQQAGVGKGVPLATQAVECFRLALTVFTHDGAPQLWLSTQVNLAATFIMLEDWPNAAKSLSDILALYPNHATAFSYASFIYHEKLFDYTEAFRQTQRWLESEPDALDVQILFAERHFTTGRFSECEQRVAGLLTKPNLEPDARVALRVIEIANLLAMGKSGPVPAKMDLLVATVAGMPAEFHVRRTFEGTRHYIGQSEKLAPRRVWLEQLFEAIGGDDRETILRGLREARTKFKE